MGEKYIYIRDLYREREDVMFEGRVKRPVTKIDGWAGVSLED